MKKTLLLTALLVTSLCTAAAMRRYDHCKQYFTVGWSGSLPMGGFREQYLSAASVNGATFQGHFFLLDNVSAAAVFGWNTYYQQIDHATYRQSGWAMSSSQRRYLHAMPLRASINYFFVKNTQWQLYAGIGFGGTYMTQHVQMQTIDWWDAQWGFSITPEAGVFYRFANHLALHASALYTASTNSFHFGQSTIHNVQSASLNIGISVLL